jgi:cytochrome c553
VAAAAAAARAEASPEELGKQAYVGCIACHGAKGEGGVGPTLAGQAAADIATKLLQYKNGETLGSQSALMWSQAAQLSDQDIDNLAAFIEAL